ncbi:MAG: hypothetical protein ACK559_01915 [bacterium]
MFDLRRNWLRGARLIIAPNKVRAASSSPLVETDSRQASGVTVGLT